MLDSVTQAGVVVGNLTVIRDSTATDSQGVRVMA